MSSSDPKKLIKSFVKEKHNLDLSDAQILEIEESLYYFTKAKIEYLNQRGRKKYGNK